MGIFSLSTLFSWLETQKRSLWQLEMPREIVLRTLDFNLIAVAMAAISASVRLMFAIDASLAMAFLIAAADEPVLALLFRSPWQLWQFVA